MTPRTMGSEDARLLLEGKASLAAFAGAGLLLAGIAGGCGVAKLLTAMAWNRAAA